MSCSARYISACLVAKLPLLVIHLHEYNDCQASKEHSEPQQDANHWANKAVLVPKEQIQIFLDRNRVLAWNGYLHNKHTG